MAACRTGAGKPLPWTIGLVVLGLGLRAYHYLRNPSVWHDEAALMVNVIEKDFGALLGPLRFTQAAPPLFLWAERVLALLLGDGPLALRLLPFLASCGALVLLAWTAWRVLEPAAMPWAVLLLACSDQVLWHTCEVKPYAVDIFCATVVLASFCATEGWPLVRRLLLFAGMAPFLILTSYPACFVWGGVLMALMPATWRERRARTWLSYGLMTLAVVGTFSLLLVGPIRAQRTGSLVDYWVGQFPPWDQPWMVPVWTFASTLEVIRYCCKPLGQVLAAVGVVGAVRLWLGGRRSVAVMLMGPLGLALAASCLRAYPYGGTRMEVYAAPAVALLIAAGVPAAWSWLARWSRLAPLLLLALLLTPLALTAYRVVIPWERADCAGAAAYVLGHRQPTDAVSGNHWEHYYYFRHIEPAFQPVEEGTWQTWERAWIVITAWTPDERDRITHRLCPHDWQCLDRQEFSRTTVLLVCRRRAIRAAT